MKNKILVCLCLSAFVALTSCKEHKVEEKVEKKGFCLSDTAKNLIAIDSVKRCDIEDEIQLSGEVNFDDNKVNKVFPRGSGQVIECKVTLGDKVQAGQVLAVVRSAEIAGSYADITSADADVAITKRQLDNQESLYKSGIASERELTEAKQNYAKALAVKHKIEVTLSINGGNKTNAGGTYFLTAPTDGYIVEKKVNAGSFLRPDMGDYLFTISDLKDVWVLANVYEADIHNIKENYAATVTTLAYPDKIFNGKIDKVSDVLDPVSKAMKVRIKLDNTAALLKPQMFTRVLVSNKTGAQSLCIPSSSVIQQNGKDYVVVYKTDCDMQIKEVTIKKITGDKTYISDELSVGDKIIVHNELIIFQKLLNN